MERTEARCQGLSVFLERGTRRETLPPDLRISTFRDQVTVAYVIDHMRDQVSILRIFGAGKDYEAILREDDPDVP